MQGCRYELAINRGHNYMIRYTDSLAGITADKLRGFFKGWKRPVSPQEHLKVLAASQRVLLAIDEEAGKVVGFVTAITDELLTAYIPLLEVLPKYRRQGIGTTLMSRMVEGLADLYTIDLICDAELEPFYQGIGMQHAGPGMIIHNLSPQENS